MMRRRVTIKNRSFRGLWWKVPLGLIAWLSVAVPTVVATTGYLILKEWSADLPRIPDLERWEETLPKTSVIVATDGTVLAEIPFQHGEEIGHRFPIHLDQVPDLVIDAFLAAEDARFFAHGGVDYRAVARAARTNYQAGRIVEGASTLTQQLARNLLPEEIGHERKFRRKVREALLARRIERRYSKERILEAYLNHLFLGASAYGIKAAARAYFDTSLDNLDVAQAATIAGLAQAPGRADPYKNPADALARRDQVLDRMHKLGLIDPGELDSAKAAAMTLTPPRLLYGTVAPWMTEQARRWVESEFPELYAVGGLRIETTVEPAVAATAQLEAREWTESLGRDRDSGAPQVGALVYDHQSGYVEQLIGGRDFGDNQYNRATQACRQPGSAFKPIVYAAAVEDDAITPGTPLRDGPIAEYDERLGVHWKPTNSGRQFRGVAIAQDALAASLNTPAVDVLDRVGGAKVIALAARLGLSTELDNVRPLALGASCVILQELVSAYAVFMRGGTAMVPMIVKRVSRDTRVIFDRSAHFDPTLPPERQVDRMAESVVAEAPRVVDEATSYLMTSMLADVIRRGTGVKARTIGRPAAGKTGTTNDNTDAWFVGFTGRVAAAVWLGHDDPSRTMGRQDDGGRAALPLWKTLVRLSEDGRAPLDLLGEVPADVVGARIDRETGLLAQPGAGGALDVFFRSGTQPTERAGDVRGVPRDLHRLTREF